MSPTQWGPPIWTLFHTLAEKIHEDKFSTLGHQLFILIKKICKVLPCPDCSMHASTFLAKINFAHIKTKSNFRYMLWHFHNSVNKRKNKPLFDFNRTTARYVNLSLIAVYNQFVNVYKTKGNMRLLADNFQRTVVLKDAQKWISSNLRHFSHHTLPSPPPPPPHHTLPPHYTSSPVPLQENTCVHLLVSEISPPSPPQQVM